jgi:hypothetical protein
MSQSTRTAGRVQGGYAASAVCGMLAGPVALAASLAATLAQPDAFSIVHHPTSDLGADTAEAAWVSNLVGSNMSGLLLLVFAVGLWQLLGRHRSARIGSSLIGVVGVGTFLTGFLTLDCREIDTPCENTSWQATGHLIVAGLISLALLVSPFVVARAMKVTAAWRDLRIPSVIFGVLTVVGAGLGSAVGVGIGQYTAVMTWFAWIIILALRMLGLATAASKPTPTPEPSLDPS